MRENRKLLNSQAIPGIRLCILGYVIGESVRTELTGRLLKMVNPLSWRQAAGNYQSEIDNLFTLT